MRRLYLAVLLAVGITSMGPRARSAQAPVQPSVDTAEQRVALRKLSACLAKARPGWARQTLAQPYLSDAQALLASRALSGQDKCIKGPEAEVVFRTSGLVGSLAEYFLQPEIGRLDLPRVTQMLTALTPPNASEDFAFCVTAASPAEARNLVLSAPGSQAEREVAQRIARYVPACLAQGERLIVDQQALRALIAVALYRERTMSRSGKTAP